MTLTHKHIIKEQRWWSMTDQAVGGSWAVGHLITGRGGMKKSD